MTFSRKRLSFLTSFNQYNILAFFITLYNICYSIILTTLNLIKSIETETQPEVTESLQ